MVTITVVNEHKGTRVDVFHSMRSDEPGVAEILIGEETM
jgi:hypothetical protein